MGVVGEGRYVYLDLKYVGNCRSPEGVQGKGDVGDLEVVERGKK